MAKKRKFQVMKRVTRNTELDPLFGKSNSFLVSDPAKAKDIEAKYGKSGTHDVHVMEDERTPHWQGTEGGLHHWTFGYSRRYAANYERIFGKAKQ